MVSTLLSWRLAFIGALATAMLPSYAQITEFDSNPVTPKAVAPNVQFPILNAELFYALLTAELAAAQGDNSTAASWISDAAREVQSEQLFERATELALLGRSGQQALRTASEWQEFFPKSRAANRYVLRILLALNRVSESQDALARELALIPKHSKAGAYAALGELYGKTSDKALAATVVEQALQQDIKDNKLAGAAWATIGRMRLKAGQTQLAMQALQHAHASEPYQAETGLLALELVEAGKSAAEPFLNDYLNAQESQPIASIALSYVQLLLQSNQLEKAQTQLTKLLEQQPAMADAWMTQANLFALQAQWEKATQALEKIASLLAQSIPDDALRHEALAPAYLLEARIALQKKDYSKALEKLQLVSLRSTDELTVQSLKAHALAKQGNLAQGRALIRAIPSSSTAQNLRKRRLEIALLRENGAPQEAYLLQNTLFKQSPNDVDIAYETALLAEAAGKPEVMEKILRDIIKQYPDHAHALNALGYSFADRGIQLDEAKQLIEKALQLRPDDPLIMDSLGWVKFRLGNTSQARQLLEKAYTQRQDAEIAAHLGEVLWSTGHQKNAIEIWRQALEIEADNSLLRKTLERLQVKL